MSDDEDVFEDAQAGETGDGAEDDGAQVVDESGLLVDEEVTSDRTIEDVILGQSLFLNNNFLESQALFQAKSEKSLYHSLGYGTILTVRAIMTMEAEDVATASKQLKNTISLANVYRRKQGLLSSLTNLVKGSNHEKLRQLTKNQLHAELIYAESVLLKSLMIALSDEGFLSLIKSGVNIRTSWFTFRSCLDLWKEEAQSSTKSDFNKIATSTHFTSGVSLGAGGFNLMLSLFPAKLLKVIEFVGFSASREVGLRVLYEGCESGGLRSPLCKLMALGYHLVAGSFLELDHIDIGAAEIILESLLKQFPTGALILYFQGKLFESKKQPTEAIEAFEKAIGSKLQWQQLHHICYWELAWCHSFNLNWEGTAKYADLLLKENKWSKAVYAYFKAASLLMNGDSKDVQDLMEKVPTYKQKIAGKSLMIEKFVIRKARKYALQGRKLVLPMLELIYAWGFLRLMGPSASKALELVDKEVVRLRAEYNEKLPEIKVAPKKGSKELSSHIVDDFLLSLLLKGTLEREAKNFDVADAAFKEIFAAEAGLTLDHYIAPFARMEHGRLLMEKQQWVAAKEQLVYAVNKYDHFSNQGRLRLRVHVMTQQVDEVLAAEKK